MVESIVYTALKALAHTFPDIAPAGTPRPWITYTVVGGPDGAYLNGEAYNVAQDRVQIDVWHNSRLEAASLMAQVRSALVNPTVKAIPLGRPVSTFEADTKLYGSRCDFSLST